MWREDIGGKHFFQVFFNAKNFEISFEDTEETIRNFRERNSMIKFVP